MLWGNMKSNASWGRRSGSVMPDGTNGFNQGKGGAYKGRTGKRPPAVTLINVPKKWFAVNYKAKRY